ncbi:amino acid--tRNA ligase-related protein [Streptomyces katrae]|uniref:amino acid--tRNA ligase-related protein n=1 Tax=Streptomyces katrae TaxID=68223 RepID=UPI0004BF65C4|nr:amino acid--tRNA ligase-related protein [Streptomyces katrae]
MTTSVRDEARRLYGTFLKENADERDLVLLKADLLRAVRDWLHATGYREVPTPVLCQDRESAPIPQFATRHPLTGQGFHLKHSAEEHLRRLIISIDRVYDLGPAIRAEHEDADHAIEFTMLQTAARDVTLADGMGMVAHLIQASVQTAFATLTNPGANFTTIYQVPVDETIAEALGTTSAPEGAELVAAARDWMAAHSMPSHGGAWEVMEAFVKHGVETAVTAPTLLHSFPYELRHNSRIDEKTGRAQRFSLIIDGVEICDGGVKLRTAADYRPMVDANIALREALHGVPADDGPLDFYADVDRDPADVFTFGLGLERLLAAVAGRSVADVLSFPFH